MDAPILAIARGLITAQVPYEFKPPGRPVSVEVFEGETPLNPIPFSYAEALVALFDNGDWNKPFALPTLVALNEDGTVNSRTNPARADSIITLFGSGLGSLSPALETGGLNPIPPAGPLSQSSLPNFCRGCQILYLGSAPGLSTSVFQANVRIVPDTPGHGVRPHGIGIRVSSNRRELVAVAPTGIVFIE